MNIGSIANKGSNMKEDSKSPPRGEETRWAVLMVRRGVALSCMDPPRYRDAKQLFTDVLKFLPRERNARRGLECISFLEKQLSCEYVKESFEAELTTWTETHSSTGGDLHVVEATHRPSQIIPRVQSRAL